MSQVSIRLERRPVSSLTPHPGNTKVHTPEQVEQISNSILRFGFNDPIGITEDGMIVEGEGRWQSAQALGMTEVPVLVLENLSERDADLYRIAHNKIALTTGFNLAALVGSLRDLMGEGIALKNMGFTDEAVAGLGLGETPVPVTSVSLDAEAANLDYLLIWDNPEQKREFEAFAKAIQQPGETVADALFRVLTQTLQTVVAEGAEDVVTQL